MPIATLITDFGNADPYAGVLKGILLWNLPTLHLVDITHEISGFDLVRAAYVLRNTYAHFPEETAHLVALTPQVNAPSAWIAFQHQGHYFLGPDNGVFSMAIDQAAGPFYRLPEITGKPELLAFSEAMGKALAHIHSGAPFERIGQPMSGIVERLALRPVSSHAQIRGTVIHIDRYENVIVNVTREVFEKVQQGRDFSLYFRRSEPITRLSEHYSDVEVGETLCLFNSAGYLEISIRMGKAAGMLGLKLEDSIHIDFH